jgi:uncharacterized protein (DUF2147 family)
MGSKRIGQASLQPNWPQVAWAGTIVFLTDWTWGPREPRENFYLNRGVAELKKVRVLGSLLASIALMNSATAADLRGTWLSQDGNAKVRVTDCGSTLCGTLVWLRRPLDSDTHLPRTDKLNPDSRKRHLPMLGLQVAKGLRVIGADRWAGFIYNADEGKSYQITLTLTHPTEATLVGCILRLICKSEHWTKI